MIFDGTTGAANFSARLFDQHAEVVVAEDVSFEPVESAVALDARSGPPMPCLNR